jgi:AcrR family transcriptional regulator
MDSHASGDPLRQPPEDTADDDIASEGPPSRERVLAAAARVFAAEGLDAPMPAVAAAAGVGVGTIYRAFGSKEELVASLAADRVEWFGDNAKSAREAPNAWDALVDLLTRTADLQAEDYVVTEALASIFDHQRVRDAQKDASDAVGELMDRAKGEGRLRPDFSSQDLHMFFAAVGAAQDSMPRGSRAWTRLYTMLLDGLSSGSPSPLTVPPLTLEEMAQAAQEKRERRRH